MRLFCVILFISTVVYGHGGEDHSKKSEKIEKVQNEVNKVEKINKIYKNKIKPIFKKSCFDCHSNSTVYPWYYKIPGVKQLIDSDIKEAKSHLDFSNDFPFKSHETPVKDLISISESLNKETMPPSKYLWLHSKSKLSKEEIKEIQDWIQKSLEILK